MLAARQIAGPSLVELRMWRWIYANPGATPEALRDATLAIAAEVWDRHYQQDFGPDHARILAAYQHMVGHPLYLADYTLGHVISHQIRAHLRGRDLAAETKRICSIGRLTPDLWMRKAVGRGVDIRPLADDCAAALGRLGVA
jgi:oligoendopeptidase F